MPYQNITLAALKVRLAQRYEGQVFWSADAARRAINEGLRIWNIITGSWTQTFTLQTIPNDPHLYVSGSMIDATQVRMSGRTLEKTSLRAMDLSISNWEGSTTGSGGIHPAQVVYWAPIGLTEIMIYPADAAPAQNAIEIDGVRATPLLVNDGDYLDLGDEEISTLLGYALHVLSFAKGILALQQTRPYKIQFYKAAAKRNATFAASDFYKKMVAVDRTRFSRPIESPPSAEAAGLLEAAK